MSSGLSRRRFLQAAGTVAAASTVSPVAKAFGPYTSAAGIAQGANSKLVLGLIGCGGMGAANMRNLMRFDDVTVAAVCDVDSARMPGDIKAVTDKYGVAPQVFKDYRQMLDRKDIDAVIIGSPDHWHALQLIDTVDAGKDAYCEKPLSHNLVESVAMLRAVERNKSVVQCGTWQRSDPEFIDAIEFVRAGKLGRVTNCRCWITDGTRLGKGTPGPVPASLDFDMWTGPAKLIPYQSNRVHWNWRWLMNYGGGLTTDWGVHMMDIALLGMGKDQEFPMPTSVAAYGGQWAFAGDDRDAPDVMEAVYRFENPDWVLSWSVKRDHLGAEGHGTEFISEDGRVLQVWRGGVRLMDPSGKELPFERSAQKVDHWRDFVDCVKTRSKPRAALSSVARTTVTCHLANAALYAGETVHWDQSKWDIRGTAGKQTQSYRREYRKGYKLRLS